MDRWWLMESFCLAGACTVTYMRQRFSTFFDAGELLNMRFWMILQQWLDLINCQWASKYKVVCKRGNIWQSDHDGQFGWDVVIGFASVCVSSANGKSDHDCQLTCSWFSCYQHHCWRSASSTVESLTVWLLLYWLKVSILLGKFYGFTVLLVLVGQWMIWKFTSLKVWQFASLIVIVLLAGGWLVGTGCWLWVAATQPLPLLLLLLLLN